MPNLELLSTLENDLKLAKQGLKDIDDNIRRVTGRDPNEARPYKRQFSTSDSKNKNRTNDFNDERISNNNKFSEQNILSTSPSGGLDLGLNSQIMVHQKRSRQDVMTNTLNAKDKARGRRMFGLLQGTLNAAKKENENSSLLIQEVKRKEIDERLEKEHQIEKEKMQKERSELFDNRRKQRIKMFILEDRISKTKEFDEWKADALKMIGFISTETTPRIFYKPNRNNEASLDRIKATEMQINASIYERETTLNEELKEIERIRQSRLSGSNKNFAPHIDEDPKNKDIKQEQEQDEEDDIDSLMMHNTGFLFSQVSATHKGLIDDDQSSNGSVSDDNCKRTKEEDTTPKRNVRRIKEDNLEDSLVDTRRVINLA